MDVGVLFSVWILNCVTFIYERKDSGFSQWYFAFCYLSHTSPLPVPLFTWVLALLPGLGIMGDEEGEGMVGCAGQADSFGSSSLFWTCQAGSQGVMWKCGWLASTWLSLCTCLGREETPGLITLSLDTLLPCLFFFFLLPIAFFFFSPLLFFFLLLQCATPTQTEIFLPFFCSIIWLDFFIVFIAFLIRSFCNWLFSPYFI